MHYSLYSREQNKQARVPVKRSTVCVAAVLQMSPLETAKSMTTSTVFFFEEPAFVYQRISGVVCWPRHGSAEVDSMESYQPEMHGIFLFTLALVMSKATLVKNIVYSKLS